MAIDTSEQLEMLGAALDLLDDGVAVLDALSRVVYWNAAAAALTGHLRMDLLSRSCPSDLYQVAEKSGALPSSSPASDSELAATHRSALVQMKHRLGHTLPTMLRNLPLRDNLGRRIGAVLLFRPAEDLDAIPHGETLEGLGLGGSQAEIEDRLEAAFHEWAADHVPFGLLWITIDQASRMRRTHGRDACEAMLRIVEHRLAQGLRPTETIGRWGSDEFLVLSHERTAEMLHAHGEHLAGLTRTADFRWWGDQVGLTASIGAAQAATSKNDGEGDTLSRLMLEAQQAMHASIYAGGNHVSRSHHSSNHSATLGESSATVLKGETCSR